MERVEVRSAQGDSHLGQLGGGGVRFKMAVGHAGVEVHDHADVVLVTLSRRLVLELR